MKKFLTIFFSFLLLLILLKTCDETEFKFEFGGVESATDNYGEQVETLANEFNLRYSYLMAVIMLESSGKKNVSARFEKDVYEKLKLVKNKKLSHYEKVFPESLKDIDDKTLREYASSWGPFQIMGYKCVELGISVDVLKGNKILYWSVKWINSNYGDYVRKKKFKDAFHLHNAGKVYPENNKPFTHDPEYVNNGLKYLEYFESQKRKKQTKM